MTQVEGSTISRSDVEAFMLADYSGGITAANNTAAAVFADYLEDNNDPRAALVRFDILIRNRQPDSDSWDRKKYLTCVQLFGETLAFSERLNVFKLDIGKVIVQEAVGDTTNILSIHWTTVIERLVIVYAGFFSKEDATTLLRRLGLDTDSDELRRILR